MISNMFDYIIVGAGSAGCVLANRLSEDPDVTVLLIEAGGRSAHPLARMPIAIPFFFAKPGINWNYESEPEAGADDRRIGLPRGKVLGGCSMINGMTYARGHRLDYDDWAASGAAGWGYSDVLPYFRKLESSWIEDAEHHGRDGPVGVQPAVCDALLFDELKDAANAAGIPATDDYHGAVSEGIARQELTTRGGRRASTAHAYLQPAIGRPNISVMTEAQVERILVHERRATGVAVRRGGGSEIVNARREVIVSAGSYNSPQLLMLSGIGPAGMLAGAGVTPLLNLPGVGANLTEHILALIDFTTDPGGFTDQLRVDRAAAATLRWLLTGTGSFATNGCSANIFTRSRAGLDRPDLQLMCMALSLGAALWHPFSKPPQHVVGAYVTALYPKSRGNVTLASPDPFDAPKIRLNLFDHPDDMQCMIDGFRITRNIYGQEPFASRTTRENSPGPSIASDEDLATYIRANVQLGHHPVSTCRMGSDAMSVVDPSLRVRGIEGLRVVDASVMPTLPGGNTNVPTIMIAEKASDIIRQTQFA